MSLQTIIETALNERERLQRALRPHNGNMPTDRRERKRVAYELARFSRRMKRLTAALEHAA